MTPVGRSRFDSDWSKDDDKSDADEAKLDPFSQKLQDLLNHFCHNFVLESLLSSISSSNIPKSAEEDSTNCFFKCLSAHGVLLELVETDLTFGMLL